MVPPLLLLGALAALALPCAGMSAPHPGQQALRAGPEEPEHLPIVLWHGMGDSCCDPESIGKVKRHLEEVLPGERGPPGCPSGPA